MRCATGEAAACTRRSAHLIARDHWLQRSLAVAVHVDVPHHVGMVPHLPSVGGQASERADGAARAYAPPAYKEARAPARGGRAQCIAAPAAAAATVSHGRARRRAVSAAAGAPARQHAEVALGHLPATEVDPCAHAPAGLQRGIVDRLAHEGTPPVDAGRGGHNALRGGRVAAVGGGAVGVAVPDAHAQPVAVEEALKVRFDLAGHRRRVKAPVHPLAVEATQADLGPRAPTAQPPRALVLVERLEGKAGGGVALDANPVHGARAIGASGGAARHDERRARGAEGLHAEAELAVDEGGPTLARLADVHDDAREDLGRHAAAVVDDAQRALAPRHEDVDRHVVRVRPRRGVEDCFRIVQAVVDKLHQDPRRGAVPLGHVIEQQRRRRHLQREQLRRGRC